MQKCDVNLMMSLNQELTRPHLGNQI